MTVETWDGKVRALISVEQTIEMFREVCFLGPLAAMYGREVRQTLMSPDAPAKIPLRTFNIQLIWGELHSGRMR